MTPFPPPSLSSRQRQWIRAVLGGRCEGCRETLDPRFLQIHRISGPAASPERRILYLCPQCSRYAESSAGDPDILSAWLERRPFRQRLQVRKILGYRSAQYVPPETESLEELYRTACTGWCLNGSG